MKYISMIYYIDLPHFPKLTLLSTYITNIKLNS